MDIKKLSGKDQVELESDASEFSLPYRAVLKEIDEQLMKRDIKTLVFLSSDVIPAGRGEEIRRGIELFEELESKRKLDANNLKFLGELFYRIQRIDLLKKLGFTVYEVEDTLTRDGSELSQFRLLLFDVLENLTSTDSQALKFVVQPGIPRLKKNSGKDALLIFSMMEKAERLTADNVNDLEKALESIGRTDLMEKVGYYRENGRNLPEVIIPKKLQNSVMGDSGVQSTQFFRPIQSKSRDSPVDIGRQANNMIRHDADDANISISTVEARIHTEGNGEVEIEHVEANSQSREAEFLEEIERLRKQLQRSNVSSYPMNTTPRGICLIISNEKFHKIPGDDESKKMPDRAGTDVDHGNLDFIFNELNFDVSLCSNLTKSEMIKRMMWVGMEIDHSRYSSFVCCILSHGEAQSVFGVDGKKVPIRELTKFFTAHSCPSLKDKPKMFFIQACQGKERMQAVGIETDAPGDLGEETIPNEADFLLSYATLPGYVSYRSSTHGSWYITKLVEMLEQHANSEDILSILLMVNEEVGRAIAKIQGGIYKQIPAPMFTLRKKVFFK